MTSTRPMIRRKPGHAIMKATRRQVLRGRCCMGTVAAPYVPTYATVVVVDTVVAVAIGMMGVA